MRPLGICISFLLFLVILVSADAILSLDGMDDYAILAEHGLLIPKDTSEFTVELWVYPLRISEQSTNGLLFHQQLRMQLVSTERCLHRQQASAKNLVCVGLTAYLEGNVGIRGITLPVDVLSHQWNYLALLVQDSKVGWVHNRDIHVTLNGFPGASHVISDMGITGGPTDFLIGGYPETWDERFPANHFHGFIRGIRVSSVARYDLLDRQDWLVEPPEHLTADEHTLVLWKFNEAPGSTRFEDASGHGMMLLGMNGASIGTPYAVEAFPFSLASLWGAMKRP